MVFLWLAFGWPLVGRWPWVVLGLALGWPWVGLGLASDWLRVGFELALGWPSDCVDMAKYDKFEPNIGLILSV